MNEIKAIKKNDTIMIPAKVLNIENNVVHGTLLTLSVKDATGYETIYVKTSDLYANLYYRLWN